MASLLDSIRSRLGLKGSVGPARDAPDFNEALARELCCFCTNGFVAGAAGSGKSSSLEAMAGAILRRSGHAALLVSVRNEPLPGFEDNPWFVSLADGTGMDLSEYLRARPARLARMELSSAQLSAVSPHAAARSALEQVFREELSRRADDPMRKLLTVLVDDAEQLFARSAIDALTAQSLSASSRFIWSVDTPWETLYANCTHRMFLSAVRPLLTGVPPDVVQELLALAPRPFELVHLSRQVRAGPALRGRLVLSAA